mmetsp:Transcript_27462/g.87269  ORF Transcript_27462/g.87269 Transcript_27462/m.87269 type:complete len:224 (+) Transcript_27462:657-1328(+)
MKARVASLKAACTPPRARWMLSSSCSANNCSSGPTPSCNAWKVCWRLSGAVSLVSVYSRELKSPPQTTTSCWKTLNECWLSRPSGTRWFNLRASLFARAGVGNKGQLLVWGLRGTSRRSAFTTCRKSQARSAALAWVEPAAMCESTRQKAVECNTKLTATAPLLPAPKTPQRTEPVRTFHTCSANSCLTKARSCSPTKRSSATHWYSPSVASALLTVAAQAVW